MSITGATILWPREAMSSLAWTVSNPCHTISRTCASISSLQVLRCQALSTSQSPSPGRGDQPSKPTKCNSRSTIGNSRQQELTTLAYGWQLPFGWPHAWVLRWPMFSNAYTRIAAISAASVQPHVQPLCSNACSLCEARRARRIISCAACLQPLRSHTYSFCLIMPTRER